MPWTVCVQRKSKRTDLQEFLYLRKTPVAGLIVTRRTRTATILAKTAKKEYWSDNMLNAMMFIGRRAAAKEAGRYKKCGGAKPFWIDDQVYKKAVIQSIHS